MGTAVAMTQAGVIQKGAFTALAKRPVQLLLFVVFAFGIFSTIAHSEEDATHSSAECLVCQLPAMGDGDDAVLYQHVLNIQWITNVLAIGEDTATELFTRRDVVARGPPSRT